MILAAPTRSCKGVGIVIPNLLDYQESMVVLDIKQENFDLTSGWRASQGQEIYLFNPFAEDRRTHRWNPLSYVSEDPAFRISDLQKMCIRDRKEVWGPTHQHDTHYLRILVGKLRLKLGDEAASPKYIATEPGVGLRFVAVSQ